MNQLEYGQLLLSFATFNFIYSRPGSRFLDRAQMTLYAVQNHLDVQGASTLIVHLVIKSAHMSKIFHEVRVLKCSIHSGKWHLVFYLNGPFLVSF